MDIPLGKEEVIGVVGVNVRHTPLVAVYFHAIPQAGNLQCTINLGEAATHE